jgi:hypothetical protein
VSLTSEYVAGGHQSYLAAYLRALPQWIDDTTRDFGDDLYEQMLLDPQVNSGVRLLKLCVLSNGIRIDPAIDYDPVTDEFETEDVRVNRQERDNQGRYYPKSDDEKKDKDRRDRIKKDARLAEEIAQFCHENLTNLTGRSFVEVMYEMLDAMALGNKVAEMTYRHEKDDDGNVRMWLDTLKVKPRKTYSFVVDPFINTIGLMALMPGTAYPLMAGSIISDPSLTSNILPREKFAVLTWAGTAGDPRGNSLLRCIYNPWFIKRNTIGELAKYLSQFASPSLLGFTAKDAQASPPTDAMGNVIPGMPAITPEQAMLNSLLAFRNGTAACFPFSSEVRPLQMSGDGAAFYKAIETCDKQIAKGILCQTLATEEGEHQARAASEMHQDILDLVVLHVKAVVAAMIHNDILRPLVAYNWGDDIARRLTPKVHLAEVERHNWAQDAAAVSSLVTSQFLDVSQYEELDAKLGLPKRKNPPQPRQGGGAPPGGGLPPPPMPGQQPDQGQAQFSREFFGRLPSHVQAAFRVHAPVRVPISTRRRAA